MFRTKKQERYELWKEYLNTQTVNNSIIAFIVHFLTNYYSICRHNLFSYAQKENIY